MTIYLLLLIVLSLILAFAGRVDLNALNERERKEL